ncbi:MULTISPECIES: AAA family ATPase [Prevotella]|jgi:putative recF/recN/SMC N domain protein|uniref:AAA family ATPase n=1 Tax=Prevotella TaxID=838 RepID=UPI000D1ED644|nr:MULTISPECIES: AAA family ATPase [Prevotella]MBW4771795.1 AAA family ATPase [Prevotella jejuni]PTL31717.1 ATPase [Prevotella sp. oral taxon 313]
MLSRVIIDGYKSIQHTDVELRPINILIGSNGVGKTNFISFFKLINIIYEQRLHNYTMQNSAERLFHYGLKQTSELKGYLAFGDNAYEVRLQARDNGSLFIAEERSYYQSSSFNVSNIDESQIKNSSTYRDRWLRDYLQSYKIFHFHDTSKGAPLRSSANINDNRYLKTDGSNLPAFLFMLQEKYPKTLRRIELTIRSVMPYFGNFSLAPSLLDESQINLQWSDIENNEKYFDANDLSDGSIRFIALATLLLQPTLPKVIIIDEPELGLHPTAIVKLAGMIKSVASRGCQIIVSTQSVNLINNFDAEDIITVDRKDKQSTFNRLNNDTLQHWLNDYSLGELWTKSIINGQPTLL